MLNPISSSALLMACCSSRNPSLLGCTQLCVVPSVQATETSLLVASNGFPLLEVVHSMSIDNSFIDQWQ